MSETNKAVITVVGEDRKGIISAMATALANHDVNILDISQTIIDKYFSMIMVVDITDATVALSELAEELKSVGESVGTVVTCQHEDIF